MKNVAKIESGLPSQKYLVIEKKKSTRKSQF